MYKVKRKNKDYTRPDLMYHMSHMYIYIYDIRADSMYHMSHMHTHTHVNMIDFCT